MKLNWQGELKTIYHGEGINQSYVYPSASKPVGNDLLKFIDLIDKVLRMYDRLYLAMNVCSGPLKLDSFQTELREDRCSVCP